MVDRWLSRLGKRENDTNAFVIRLFFAEHSDKIESHQILPGRREGGGRRALDKVVNSLCYETLMLLLLLMLPLTLRRARFARGELSWAGLDDLCKNRTVLSGFCLKLSCLQGNPRNNCGSCSGLRCDVQYAMYHLKSLAHADQS